MAGAERRPFEQAEDDAAQAKDREHGAAPVDPGGPGRIAAFIHEPERQHEHDGRERHVQEKHGAPADVFDQPAADDRADRRRDRAESRPRPDRPSAIGVVERGADDREAARHEEGGADALQRAAGDEVRGDAARPQRTDATVNKTTPTRNTRLRPNWSPIEPPTRISAPRNSA